MVKFELRQMTPQERKTLLRIYRGQMATRFFFYFILYVLGFPLGITFLLILFAFFIHPPQIIYEKILGWACLFGALSGAVFLYRKMRQKTTGFRELEDLFNKNVEVWHIEAREVIQLGSDDGLSWYFNAGDTELVYLAEWDFSCKLNLRKFPCQSFSFIRYPHSQLITGVSYEGILLKPKRFYSLYDLFFKDDRISSFRVVKGEAALKVLSAF